MSTSTHPLPRKKDVAMALLQGPSVFIHLDPRKPEVVVPSYFKKQPQLVLQVGLNMAIAIPDLKVDDEGVTCTLSFNRRPFWCRLPWTAIYALVGEALDGEDMKGMLWPDDVPAEIAAQRDVKGPQAVSPGPQRARSPREPKRKAVAVGAPASEPKPNAGAPKSASRSSETESEGDSTAEPAAMPQPKRDGAKSGKRELPPYLRVVK
jgi:Stringent starvation protein B